MGKRKQKKNKVSHSVAHKKAKKKLEKRFKKLSALVDSGPGREDVERDIRRQILPEVRAHRMVLRRSWSNAGNVVVGGAGSPRCLYIDVTSEAHLAERRSVVKGAEDFEKAAKAAMRHRNSL